MTVPSLPQRRQKGGHTKRGRRHANGALDGETPAGLLVKVTPTCIMSALKSVAFTGHHLFIAAALAIDCEMVLAEGDGTGKGRRKCMNVLASFTAVNEEGEVVYSTYVKADRPVRHCLSR